LQFFSRDIGRFALISASYLCHLMVRILVAGYVAWFAALKGRSMDDKNDASDG